MPDFNPQMPEWLNMGDDQQQMGNAVSPFADALKKRMNQPKPSGPFNVAEPSFSGMLGGGGGVLGSTAPKKGGLMGKSF